MNRLDWSSIDTLHFAAIVLPRAKTLTPQELAIPETMRENLRGWWEAHGSSTSGPVFPARKGANAGGFKVPRGKHLRRTFPARSTPRRADRFELHNDTAVSQKTDFHSHRRAFSTALTPAT